MEKQTVKIYKWWNKDMNKSSFHFKPWPHSELEGYDDGGKDYLLPEGYSVGESAYGQEAVFKEGIEYGMELENEKGHPAVWNVKDGLVILKVAPQN